ncbi:MAG TPA: hypothetical protein VFH10_09970 [Nocardioides sp.]|uniref:hypothetical protein n=1 Tax=Nocardioides sp. TaxID=35761 RepID=UPI002D7ED1DA|nr:hypothetical protein [Nocardioides sp.]HET6652955.1 hypothetical protein [Nocardioides sp.]
MSGKAAPAEARPTLTMWTYDSPLGATAGEMRLRTLRQHGALRVHDAITITWMAGSHAPRTGRLRHGYMRPRPEQSMLAAIVDPLLQIAAGGGRTEAALNEVAAALEGTGVDLDALRAIGQAVTPGTSSLLVLASHADPEVIRPVVERGLARGDLTLIRVSLAPGGIERIRDVARTLDLGA